jgi:rapamycin-insensitive companion of mTOR
MSILESHHFRLPVCRFVIDLFDKKVMRQIVLEEEDEEDSDDSEEEGSSGSDLDIGLPNGSSNMTSA